MNISTKLWQAGLTLAIGCALVFSITVLDSALSKSNPRFPASVMRLGARLFTPAQVMAQASVEGKGKVIAVTLEKQEVVLEHGEIKGFMDAMTMGYKVSSPALLKGLKPGDQVQFTIDTKKSVITKVAKVKNQ